MLLQPENGGKGTGEEDALGCGEGYKTFGESGALVRNPTESPVSLAVDARDGLDGVEEELPHSGVYDVGVDEEGVCLGMNLLHNNLEAIEATSFSGLDFVGKAPDEVLIDNVIRGSK
jgi:hypothetical protein